MELEEMKKTMEEEAQKIQDVQRSTNLAHFRSERTG